MDRFGDWRPIEPAADDDAHKQPSAEEPANPGMSGKPEASGNDARLLALLGAGVLAVTGAVIWFTSTSAQPSLAISGQVGLFDPSSSTASEDESLSESPMAAGVVVDVQGAVLRPGVLRLNAGSRVGDAIAAAGGYSAQVDIESATALLNLAELLTDGEKIYVPGRGEAAGAGSAPPREPTAVDPGGAGGLINVNTATSEQLDTLPGIGPVTAAKIIAARDEAPFASVDDLLSREVLGASTFDKVRALVTIGP
jgi:competence protein ComEA